MSVGITVMLDWEIQSGSPAHSQPAVPYAVNDTWSNDRVFVFPFYHLDPVTLPSCSEMDHRPHEVVSRAKSLRQRFADSRTSASSSLSTSPSPSVRWQQSHYKTTEPAGCGDGTSSLSPRLFTGQLQSSPESELLAASSRLNLWKSGGGGGGNETPLTAGSKSPSPSRTSGKCGEKRPSSVSWMMSPRGHCSRPATPTAAYQLDSCALASAAAVAAVASSSGAQQVRQLSDDFATELVVDPSFLHNSKVRNRPEEMRQMSQRIYFIWSLPEWLVLPVHVEITTERLTVIKRSLDRQLDGKSLPERNRIATSGLDPWNPWRNWRGCISLWPELHYDPSLIEMVGWDFLRPSSLMITGLAVLAVMIFARLVRLSFRWIFKVAGSMAH